MPQEGVPLKLAYLLRDPNSGAAVVQDLFHIHQSTWTVRALLPGYPGSSTIGDFTIKLPPPYTEEFKRNSAQYRAILNSANEGIGLKVEGYLGDVVTGTPVLSGVVTKMNLPLDGPWELSGSDTLYWLQQSQIYPGEEGSFFYGVDAAGDVITAFYGSSEVLWDDDFSLWSTGTHPNSTDYGDSGFTAATDPQRGLPALTATVDDSYVLTNTTFTSSMLSSTGGILMATQITAWGVASATTTGAAFPGVWAFADATRQNGCLVQLGLVYDSTAKQYNVSATLYTRSSGTFTQQQSTANEFTNVGATFPFELTCVIYSAALQNGINSVVAYRIILNGKDTGVVEYFGQNGPNTPIPIPSSGNHTGIRAGITGTGAQVWFNRFRAQTRITPNQVALDGKVQRFQTGALFIGNPIGAVLSGKGQSFLDLILLLAAYDGASVRKTPGAGAKADTLDYNTGLGSDLSSSVMFEEQVNVLAQGSTLQNVAEVYAGETRVNSIPVNDSGGTVTWPSHVASSGEMVLTDTVSDVGSTGFEFLFQYGRAIAARKGAPLAATQLRVVRTSDFLRANNGWGPRELDFVQVHMPTYQVNHQKAQIVGYALTEGDATAVYYLTQFPESRMPQAALQRLIRSVDFLGTTYQSR